MNAFSRTHDVPNLFLVDGSNFVTAARQQPTATIQALAYRAADHAIAAVRRGEIRPVHDRDCGRLVMPRKV